MDMCQGLDVTVIAENLHGKEDLIQMDLSHNVASLVHVLQLPAIEHVAWKDVRQNIHI